MDDAGDDRPFDPIVMDRIDLVHLWVLAVGLVAGCLELFDV